MDTRLSTSKRQNRYTKNRQDKNKNHGDANERRVGRKQSQNVLYSVSTYTKWLNNEPNISYNATIQSCSIFWWKQQNIEYCVDVDIILGYAFCCFEFDCNRNACIEASDSKSIGIIQQNECLVAKAHNTEASFYVFIYTRAPFMRIIVRSMMLRQA